MPRRWPTSAIAVRDSLQVGNRLPPQVVLGTGGGQLGFFRLDDGTGGDDSDPATGSAPSRRPVATADRVAGGISTLAFVPAGPGIPGGGLAAGDVDGVVRFWAADEAGDLVPGHRSRPHQGDVSGVVVVPSATVPFGVSCGQDRRVAVWPLSGADTDDDLPDLDLAGASRGPAPVSVVRTEGGGIRRWSFDADGRLVQLPTMDSTRPEGVAVTHTVGGDGMRRRYRADLETRSDGPPGRRRGIRLNELRALAVTDVDGIPHTVVLSSDGSLATYRAGDDAASHTTATGHPLLVSVAIGPGPAGKPLVVTGDVDGVIRAAPYAAPSLLAAAPEWPLGRSDVYAAVAADLLLTGDAMGGLRLWSIRSAYPESRGELAGVHRVPVVAVELADGFALSGDRGGTLGIVPVESGWLAGAAAHRTHLGSRILSITAMGPAKALVWCRRGAVVLDWD